MRGGEADVLLERLARVEQQSRYLLGGEADPARLDRDGAGGHVASVNRPSTPDRAPIVVPTTCTPASAMPTPECGVDDAADDAAGGRLRFTLRGELTGQRDEEKKYEPANQ